MIDFIDGGLWYFSLAVFSIGVVWRLLSIALGKRGSDLSSPRRSATPGALRTLFSRFIPTNEVWSKQTLQVIAGYMFHLGLFALLFFALPHVRFLEAEILGFGWAAMPHWAFIVAAQLALLGLLILWLHRLLNPVTRLISTKGDHIASILTFVVMLTGCLALLEEFEALRALHRFSVEIFLIYFPFSRLMHTFTFVPSRAFTGAWFGRRGVNS